MTDSRVSRRIRLSAAQRLDALLERQEKREASVARRTEREQREAAKREERAFPAPEDTAAREAEERTQRGLKLMNEVLKKGS
ncbi:hypothetical protein [Terriglobus roseus]|nr:hypothetical protein [Terriglobus roseus]